MRDKEALSVTCITENHSTGCCISIPTIVFGHIFLTYVVGFPNILLDSQLTRDACVASSVTKISVIYLGFFDDHCLFPAFFSAF